MGGPPKDDKLLGVFVIYRREVRPFLESRSRCYRILRRRRSSQWRTRASLNETREALEQQTATTEILQVINSSPCDLARCSRSILERAHALCETFVWRPEMYDGERFRIRWLPKAYRRASEEFLVTRQFAHDREDPFGRMVEGAPTFTHPRPVRNCHTISGPLIAGVPPSTSPVSAPFWWFRYAKTMHCLASSLPIARKSAHSLRNRLGCYRISQPKQ